jgi:hypothetical protein
MSRLKHPAAAAVDPLLKVDFHPRSHAIWARANTHSRDFARMKARARQFPPDRLAGLRPRPENILLVVEVADTSLRYDRDVKLPRHVGSGITEAWLIDLEVAGLPGVTLRADEILG